MTKKLKGFRANMTDEEFEAYLKLIKTDEEINDEYTKLFKEKDINEEFELYNEREHLRKKWSTWGTYNDIHIKKCSHFGEVNIFNLVPITCYGLKTEEIIKLIQEKNIKSWLILDIGCLLNLEIDKIDVKFYFAPIDDFSVPSFNAMDDIIKFVAENVKMGNMLVSCIGGHGRTGTVLSIWAGLHDIEKPIEYVRKIYCNNAVETISQEMFVNIYLKYLRSL